MSQPATRSSPVILGSNARALSVPLTDPAPGRPATAPEKSRRGRTPLSLVVSPPQRSSRSLMTILFLVVVTALTVVLVMSISVSKGQYEMVSLTNQQAQLYKTNQSLEQQIAAKQAPQQLVASAAALGMVPAGTTGQIDIRTGQVSGSPQPAPADTKGLASIPPALIDKPLPATDSSAKDAAAKAVGPLSPAAVAAQQAAAKKDSPAPAPTPAPVAPELNGGTIPAPLEKDS